MKKLSSLSLLLMSIVTILFTSCGAINKNNADNPNVISDDDTYVAVGDFTSPQMTLTGKTVAVDVDLKNHEADMTLYNFSLDGVNTMTVVAEDLHLESTKTTCVFTIDTVIPIIKTGDKDILLTICPMAKVSGTIDAEAKTMVIEFTLAYINPMMQKTDIPVVFNGKLVEGSKAEEVIPEDAKKTVDYEAEYAAKGVLKVDGKVIPNNKVRIAIDKDDMRAVMYFATLSLDNGKNFVTLEAQDLSVAQAAQGYQISAESVIPTLETGAQSIYFPSCTFRQVDGMINTYYETIQVDLIFVYVDPQTGVTHEYPASFFGSMIDPEEVEEPVDNIMYDNDFLASGVFTADQYEVENRLIGVDVDMNTMTADVSFYAFTYMDDMPELTVKNHGLQLQKSGNVYTFFSNNELIPYVVAGNEEVAFEDARFVNMQGTVDADTKTMTINFTVVYTDPNTKQVYEYAANYTGVLSE